MDAIIILCGVGIFVAGLLSGTKPAAILALVVGLILTGGGVFLYRMDALK